MRQEVLKQIIKKSKLSEKTIKNKIYHPITQQKLPQRNMFVLLKKYANDFFKDGSEPRAVGLVGLRGTGKTTLMWQFSFEFIKSYPIYFFNVNEIVANGFSLSELLSAFEKYALKKSFRELKEPLILLFDEVHDANDWTNSLKILYDEAKSVFILCSGSSALLLRQTADLARRVKMLRLYPFRFFEFVTAKSFFVSENKHTIFPLKGFNENLKNSLFYSENIDQVFDFLSQKEHEIKDYFNKIEEITDTRTKELVDEYIYYKNIPLFLLYKEKLTIVETLFELLRRVIYEDIKKLDEMMDIDYNAILKLLFQLSISDEINFNSLSKNVGIKKDEIEKIIEIIKNAEIINVLDPYSIGAEGRVYKNKKAFFMSPSLRLSLLSTIYGLDIPNEQKGKLYEDIVVMYLTKILPENKILFLEPKDGLTPDLIIDTRDKPVVIEIGASKTKSNQLKKIEKRYGILISAGLNRVQKDLGSNTLKLPLHYFLLL